MHSRYAGCSWWKYNGRFSKNLPTIFPIQKPLFSKNSLRYAHYLHVNVLFLKFNVNLSIFEQNISTTNSKCFLEFWNNFVILKWKISWWKFSLHSNLRTTYTCERTFSYNIKFNKLSNHCSKMNIIVQKWTMINIKSKTSSRLTNDNLWNLIFVLISNVVLNPN